MVTVSWSKITDADGYVIRLGIAPDKLYNNYQVLSKDSVSCVIRSLNVGTTYYFAMDVYNSCGVTKGLTVKRDDNVTSVEVPCMRAPEKSAKATFVMIGNRIVVSQEFAGKSYHVRVFDISGKLLFSSISKNKELDVPQNLLSHKNVYIVNFSHIQ